MIGNDVVFFSVPQIHRAEIRTANACGILEHGLEDRLQVALRRRDDLQHFRRRGLLLQRFAQIVGALAQFLEQPRVLDGDHGLVGEVRHELDLLVGERQHLLADRWPMRADQLVLLEHRNDQERPRAAQGRRRRTDVRKALEIRRLRA